MSEGTAREAVWPELPLAPWRDTCETLHLWLQVVGKVRWALAPPLNHSWQATLYVTPRGLTTSPIPHGTRTFEIDFDFLDHRLLVLVSDGGVGGFALEPRSVADFYGRLQEELARLRVPARIRAKPNEIPDPIPFAEDTVHRSYDAGAARRFWQALVQADRVFKEFRGRFLGKCSPVHLFWGALDLAVTRFSGRPAPPHPGGIPNLPDRITREAYSHEVSSCGFWPGSGPVQYPAFYAYAYPEPRGFGSVELEPREASYNEELREFVLPYDAVRTAESPDALLLRFLQSSYEAAARLGDWDRRALEWTQPEPPRAPTWPAP
jgi:hypothetical protein